MPNLFWSKPSGQTLNAVESPFRTEEELESYLYGTRELFSDLLILKRQVRTGNRSDIPDLIAVDKEGSVVIIELKNGLATEDVIPQVLRYAIWAETSPDSIRALWLEMPEKPEDISISWDNLTVKIVIIAPSFSPRVLRLSNKINYPVELIEIKRFSIGDDEFILTNQLQAEPGTKPGITRGQQVYDREFYMENRNKDSVPRFFDTVKLVDQLVQDKNWNLEKKMNKFFVSYKYGFPVVFGITWIGSKSFALFFKLPKDRANAISIPDMIPHRYEDEWKQVLYKIENPRRDVKRLLPLFEAAFRHITGAEEAP